MKQPKKITILIVLSITIIFAITFWYRTTPQHRARHLVRQLRSTGDPPNLIEKALLKLGPRFYFLLPEEDSNSVIISEIIDLGPDAVPALIPALNDQDQTLSRNAMTCLMNIKSPSVEAEKVLLELIKHENSNIKNNAAYALIVTSTEIQQTIPFILHSFSDPEHPRYFLTHAMAEKCIQNQQLISLILNFLQDDDKNIRIFTLMLLREIGPHAQSAVPQLQSLLNDQDFTIRFEAAWALFKIDPTLVSPQIIDILIEALNNDFYRTVSFDLLGDIGPPAQKAVPQLRRTLNDEYWYPRHEAALSLFLIDPHYSTNLAVKTLINDLQSPDSWDRTAAMHTLADIGPPASDAVPLLQKSLFDQSGDFDPAAAFALWKIDPDDTGPWVMDHILTELENFTVDSYLDEPDYLGFLSLLERIGLPAQKTIPILLEKLDHLDTEMKAFTITTLGVISPQDSIAVPFLEKALKDKKAMIRSAAREALKKIQK
ncbi:MAG: HEAT repeat domain-containing protein [Planctomycetes bacterium]|nr:HEAT repeat domain-containing protein [Planctomycetota bacterium]